MVETAKVEKATGVAQILIVVIQISLGEISAIGAMKVNQMMPVVNLVVETDVVAAVTEVNVEAGHLEVVLEVAIDQVAVAALTEAIEDQEVRQVVAAAVLEEEVVAAAAAEEIVEVAAIAPGRTNKIHVQILKFNFKGFELYCVFNYVFILVL